MRNQKRIPEILNELERIWKEYPDLRLGQIIMIATRPKNPCPEVFYIEDDNIFEGLKLIGKINEANDEKRKKIPYWERYPEIIRIEIEQLTPELVKDFLEVIQVEEPNLIITPRSIMKLIGAPVDDINWMAKQKERVEKLKQILSGLEEQGELEAVEIGYEISKWKACALIKCQHT